ncbi:MAG: transcription-repair coupling factor, partial [Chrysiogenetes bacterium]|nr:transcription-repair coupling factor [Chrysiogenetes bacterium]
MGQEIHNDRESLRRAGELLGGGGKVRLGGLRASAGAWALAQLQAAGYQAGLVVCPTPERALTLYEDLAEFLGTDRGTENPATPERRRLLYLPAWEQRPYDNRSAAVEHQARRMSALYGLLHRPDEVTVVGSVAAIMQLTAPREALYERYEYLIVGADTEFAELPERLTALGYRRGPRAEDRGEFAVKGGILDVFAPGYDFPLRLEFFDNELESVRFYDPSTQRSIKTSGKLPIEEIYLLPMQEIFFEDEPLRRAMERLSEEQQAGTAGFQYVTDLKNDLKDHQRVPGLEYLLSHFYRNVPTLLDHLGEKAHLAVVEAAQVERQFDVVGERLEIGYERRREAELPASDPRDLFADAAKLREELFARANLLMEETEGAGEGEDDAGRETLVVHSVRSQTWADSLRGAGKSAASGSRGESPLQPLVDQLSQWRGEGRRVIVASHTHSQQERISELLKPYEIPTLRSDVPVGSLSKLAGPQAEPVDGAEPLHLIHSTLSAGFALPDADIVVLTEEEISGTHRKRTRQAAPKLEGMLNSLADLAPDDFIVHGEHGIGRFRGLEHMVMGGHAGDYLVLEYAGGDKLYVPAHRIRAVAKFSGPEGVEARLDKMGGARWKTKRQKVREAVYKLAAELLDIYAAREVNPGFAYPPLDEEYRAFEAAFEFDETPDQERAIGEVLADMLSPRPMDRLVCGDVGFGKTEVAIRAAFEAVHGGKQVAVLVPTTVLVEQHAMSFERRLDPYGVRVSALSRLHSAAEQKDVLADLAAGRIDVIIGTHRLIQRDVAFKDLGLVIIDEEQRFGVKHKERFKKMRRTVDVLTLSATPIPRTMHMAMSGMRDLSIIATPPTDRLSIRTVVSRKNDQTIREAIDTEVARGGQVFYVHNRVKSIEDEANHVRELCPNVRIHVAHGQMEPKQLEKVMLSFLRGEFQVLMCTSIIESGLDIPNANTLIVDRADMFGLSQLYQIRGRVGRGARRAYAYLLLPESGKVTDDAEKRLDVLQEHSDLGAGFRIATYDLELRGGGNLLGDSQSGHIAAVGLELYTEL